MNRTVVFVLQDLYRLGAQYVTALLANGLADRGYQVDVVVSAVHDRIGVERPDLKPFLLRDVVRLVTLPHLRASQNVFALAQYLRVRYPDVVISMASHYFPIMMMASKLAHRKTKTVNVEHSSGIGLPNDYFGTKHNPYRDYLHRTITKWSLSQVDKVVTVSNGVATALNMTYDVPLRKMMTIYNPVVDSVFLQKRQQSCEHPWLRVKDCPVIVAAGAHVSFKAHDILLRAFKIVTGLQNCRLIIYGEGPLTNALKKLTEELDLTMNVDFPGYTHNLPAELNKADVFVVSSHCESFSVVLVEALACGVPVVATDCPSGPREILRGGEYGLLVQPGDPGALADGIMKSLSGDRPASVPESWSPYTIDNAVDQYESMLRGLFTSC